MNESVNLDEWDDPVPLGRSILPEWPLGVLPGWMEEFAGALSASFQVPRDLPAMASLALIAAAVQGRLTARVDTDWREALAFWPVVIMDSGTAKSPPLREIRTPIRKHEARLISEWEQEAERIEALPKEERIPIPPAPRLLAGDATPEAVGALLNDQEGRIAFFEDEGTILSNAVGGRYSKGNPRMENFLHGYEGGEYRCDRKGGQSILVPETFITMMLAIQPVIWEAVRESKEAAGQGWVARCLTVAPDCRLGHRETEKPPPVPEAVRERFHQLAARLLRDTPTIGGLQVRFTPEATREVRAFKTWLEPRLVMGGSLSSMAEWTSKLAGQVARVAAFRRLGEAIATDAENWYVEPVGGSDVRIVVKWAKEYLIPHARWAHFGFSNTPATADAMRVLNHVRDKKKLEVSYRDMGLMLRSRGRSAIGLADKPTALLVKHGFLKPLPVGGTGGRPSKGLYTVNPRLWMAPSEAQQSEQDGD